MARFAVYQERKDLGQMGQRQDCKDRLITGEKLGGMGFLTTAIF